MSPNASSPVHLDPEAWSALVDGEASHAELDAALTAWRRTPAAESHWHAYHLIGDSLRSSDLAAPRARDARLLAAVRARLAAEPVVLAPTSSTPATATPAVRRIAQRRWRRMTGAATMVAGVGAVGAMVWLTQAPSASESRLAERPAALPAPTSVSAVTPGVVVPVSVAGAPTGPAMRPVGGPMLRDPRLDEYFAAHRQLGSGRPLGTPAGFALPDAAPAR